MFVMPFPFGVILHFFPDERFVSFMPGTQKIVETAGTSLPKIGDDPFQLDGSGHLWIPGQVAGDDGIIVTPRKAAQDIIHEETGAEDGRVTGDQTIYRQTEG